MKNDIPRLNRRKKSDQVQSRNEGNDCSKDIDRKTSLWAHDLVEILNTKLRDIENKFKQIDKRLMTIETKLLHATKTKELNVKARELINIGDTVYSLNKSFHNGIVTKLSKDNSFVLSWTKAV
mmetsp:Transcript_14743/g.21056  ORF Transcript_14743/g.21056 Transcript_14743/m.21056 type:complete len:123 (-) Transcript_14743:1790-2158(-)